MTMQIRTAAGANGGANRACSGSDLTETQRHDWGTRVHELAESGNDKY